MLGQSSEPVACVCGTFDTKGVELQYVAGLLRAAGLPVRTVDLGTSGADREVDVPAPEVAAHHPQGAQSVLGGQDRGAAVVAMALAFERWAAEQGDIGGMIGAGGSGNTALV